MIDENTGVGPQRYNPNWNSVLRVGPSAPILARTVMPDNSLTDEPEPGPGHYTVPDPFQRTDPPKRASPVEVREPGKKH